MQRAIAMSRSSTRSMSDPLGQHTNLEPITEPTNLVPVTTLGRGSYGKVVLARASSNNGSGDDDLVAVKIVAKGRLKSRGQMEKAQTELRVMKNVAPSSPFLIPTRGAFQTDECLVYIMPYSPGGELFFHLSREGRFSESRTRLITMQVILGLEHLHSHGVLYRDLKPENILISLEGRCQLADFGLSKFLPRIGNNFRSASDYESQVSEPVEANSGKKRPSVVSRIFGFGKRKNSQKENDEDPVKPKVVLAPTSDECIWGTTRTRCGTPAYQSTEIVMAKEHSLEADWWALGVLVFEMLVGEPPFFANTVKEVYDLILANNPRYSKRISDRARNLISSFLVSDRTKRNGYGRNGVSNIKGNIFFTEIPPDFKSSKNDYPTFEQVAKLVTQPVVFLSETGIVGAPKDAVFFHADYTSIDVREHIVPVKSKFNLEGFTMVPQTAFDSFVSSTPIPVMEKGGASNGPNGGFDVADDLKKETVS